MSETGEQEVTATTGASDGDSAKISCAEQNSEKQAESDSTTSQQPKTKVDILLKAAGNAPIMKKKKWAVDPDKKIGWVIEFIRKYLKLDQSESLFLYVNQSFAPAPDQIVRNLYECFGTDGKLILHYCKSQAWG